MSNGTHSSNAAVPGLADVPDARLCFDVPGKDQQHSSSHLELSVRLRAGWVQPKHYPISPLPSSPEQPHRSNMTQWFNNVMGKSFFRNVVTHDIVF